MTSGIFQGGGGGWTPWGERALRRVPPAAAVPELAALLRQKAGQGPDERLDLSALCRSAGARVRVARLGGREGSLEAMLAPLPGDRFGISVDPTPVSGWDSVPKRVRQDLERHRLRFRISHELAHTLFYARGAGQPRRQVLDSAAQEEFCDALSRELLVPRALAVKAGSTPRGLLKLQAACDVSLEVAARALAAAQSTLEVALWFLPPGREKLKLQWGAKSASKRALTNPPERAAPNVTWLGGRRQLILVR